MYNKNVQQKTKGNEENKIASKRPVVGTHTTTPTHISSQNEGNIKG